MKTLVIYHHDPDHNDDYLDRVGEDACASFPGAIMAKEGLVIPVNKEFYPQNGWIV